MKKRRIIIITTSLVGVVILYLGMIFIGGGIISGALFNPRINQEQMERIFVDDYDLLRIVVDYLADSEYMSVYFFSERDAGLMSVRSSGLGVQHISVNDEDVVNAIKSLRERGYGHISKNDNLISFLRWSMVGRGRGILYSIDNTPPDTSIFTFFTILEPLSRNGWFFYEEN